MAGGSGPLSRRYRYRDDRAKFRVKSLALPTLPEDYIEEEKHEVSPDHDPSSWPCSVCTFINSGWLLKCEVCETPCVNAVAKREVPSEDVNGVDTMQENGETEERLCTKSDNWPSLTEAVHSFIDCEVSSLASSWQDLGEVANVEDDDSDVIIVNASHQSLEPVSWAALAKSIAASGPVVSLPAAGVTAPPLKGFQLKQARRRKDVDVQSEADWELDALEDRRLRIGKCRKASPPHCRRC